MVWGVAGSVAIYFCPPELSLCCRRLSPKSGAPGILGQLVWERVWQVEDPNRNWTGTGGELDGRKKRELKSRHSLDFPFLASMTALYGSRPWG